jgi:L-threonylcarbamoyladenylate synthase
MRILPTTPKAVNEAIRVIRAGGVVCHPTETCYGFACDLTNVDALERLFALKGRPASSPVSALFPSIGGARKYVEWNDEAEELACKYLPGPLTLVLPLLELPDGDAPPIVRLEGQETLGIRISSHPVALELARKTGTPLSTTSANIHNEPPPYSVEDVLAQFGGRKMKPDLILDGGALPKTASSTVVLVKDGHIEVLRQGGVGVAEV